MARQEKEFRGYSPSQTKAHEMCVRRWFASYILGMRDGGSEATERGTAIHSLLEHYLLGEIPLDSPRWESPYGKILRPALETCFPRPLECLPEADVSFTFGNFHQVIADVRVNDPKCPRVYDLKTVGSMSSALSKPGMKRDVQVILNACAALDANPDAESVSCHWVYVNCKNPGEYKVVSAVFEPDELFALYSESIQPVMLAILGQDKAAAPADLVGNPKSCVLFPPQCCPFQPLCGVGEKSGGMKARPQAGLGDPRAWSERRRLRVMETYQIAENEAEALWGIWTGELATDEQARADLRSLARLSLFQKAAEKEIARSHDALTHASLEA